jgi:hypothetical protein
MTSEEKCSDCGVEVFASRWKWKARWLLGKIQSLGDVDPESRRSLVWKERTE